MKSLLPSGLNFTSFIKKKKIRTLSSKGSILNVRYVKQVKTELFSSRRGWGQRGRVWSLGSLSSLSLSSLSQAIGGLHGACLLKPSPNAKSLSSIIGGGSLFNLCLITSNDKKLIASQSSLFYLFHLFRPLRYL